MMKLKSNSRSLAVWSLLCLAVVVFIGKSYETSLNGIDANIHARAALSVTQNGFFPKLPILLPNEASWKNNPSFNDHPFFYFYINGWVMRAFGPSAWSARLLTALFGLGCIFFTYALGTALRSKELGFLAAFILMTTREFIFSSASMSLDPPMLFFILLSFYFWRMKKWGWMGLACGFGLWIKTPVVLLVFPTAVLLSFFESTYRKEFHLIVKSFLLALTVGSLVWIMTGLGGGWDLVLDYWQRQIWGTAFEGRGSALGKDYWLFFYSLKGGYWPWFILLFLSIPVALIRRSFFFSEFLVPFVGGGVLILIISFLRFKQSHYFLPCYPFLALLSASILCPTFEKYGEKIYKGFTFLTPLLFAVIITCPISFGPEFYPHLRKFAPFIQEDRNCNSKILLVRGGEPYKSALDFTFWLNFYTAKTTLTANCGEANALAKDLNPGWIILSNDNFEHCLSSENKARFSIRFVYDGQTLLKHDLTPRNVFDLTPLKKEMAAVRECGL